MHLAHADLGRDFGLGQPPDGAQIHDVTLTPGQVGQRPNQQYAILSPVVADAERTQTVGDGVV